MILIVFPHILNLFIARASEHNGDGSPKDDNFMCLVSIFRQNVTPKYQTIYRVIILHCIRIHKTVI